MRKFLFTENSSAEQRYGTLEGVSAMAGIERTSFDSADETRTPDKGTAAVVEVARRDQG